jgi:thioredoxin 1
MVATMDSDMKNIIELTEDNFETEVLRATGPVLVDFYAPWCGPCMMIAPLLEQFAADFAGKVKFAKVNIDHAPALTSGYEITGVPTLMLFRGSEAVDQVVGFSGPRQFKAWLDKASNAAITT